MGDQHVSEFGEVKPGRASACTGPQQDESGPIPFADTAPGVDEDVPLERRHDHHFTAATLDAINARFARGAERMSRIEASQAENTRLTRAFYEIFVTVESGLVAVARFGRGLAAVARWIVKTLKWAAPLAVAYLALKHDLGELLKSLAAILKGKP